jgi:hypothetical protein
LELLLPFGRPLFLLAATTAASFVDETSTGAVETLGTGTVEAEKDGVAEAGAEGALLDVFIDTEEATSGAMIAAVAVGEASTLGKISASQPTKKEPEPLAALLWGKALSSAGGGAPGIPPKYARPLQS